MGLLSFFKKKPKVTITFQAPICKTPEWKTWKKTNGNSDNDYANAVFLNLHKAKWRKPHTLSDTENLSHKLHKLGITNPAKKHSDMLKAGYFCEAAPAEILNTYRIKDLQEILTKHGIVPDGRKADLINTILKSIPVKKLKLPVMYFISDKGIKYIQQHDDLIKLFGNPYNITYEEYMAVKANAPSYLKYSDLIWQIFNRRELSFEATDAFSRRYNAYYRAEFLYSEGKNDAAFLEYLSVIYYDVNKGISDYLHIAEANRSRTSPLIPETTLNDHLLEAVLRIKECYSKDMVMRCTKRTFVVKKHISDSDFASFVDSLFTTGESSFLKYAQKKRAGCIPRP